MSVVSTAFEPYSPVGNLFYQNMAIGILLKLDKLAYLELNVRMAISYKLVACLLLLVCLGGHLDLCLSIQVSHYPKVSN